MMFRRLNTVLVLVFFIGFTKPGFSQSVSDKAYLERVHSRSFNIVQPLAISDSVKFYAIRDQVAQQYINIRLLDERQDKELDQIKKKFDDTIQLNKQLREMSATIRLERKALNDRFIQSLSKHLNDHEIDKIKDGLTYGVFHLTYHVFMQMIPELNKEEENHIYHSLSEARDRAMALGSSQAKDSLFEEYRKEINLYLAAKGYNLEQERKNWYERLNFSKSQ